MAGKHPPFLLIFALAAGLHAQSEPQAIAQELVGDAEQRVIQSVVFQGARRVPQDTLRALVSLRAGHLYDANAVNRGLLTLWNSKRFDDIRVAVEARPGGLELRFVVAERTIRRDSGSIDEPVVTINEILDRFRARKAAKAVTQ